MSKDLWTDKVINSAQLGGIETSILDNGMGKGTRIAWVNTGSGLWYKIAIDRSMDIVEAFYNQHSLAFLTHGATVGLRPDVNHGTDWLDAFNCGLLTTCGLSHFGGPESDEFGERGQHGKISNIPAQLECVVNPDIYVGKKGFCISGIIKETRMFGPNLELRRKISGVLGEPKIKIEDMVINRSNFEVPHMILYHCNLGFPLVDDGTEIIFNGKCRSRGNPGDDAMFSSKNDFKKCPKPLDSHSGTGEGCGFIDPVADRNGICIAGLYNPKINLALQITFKKEQLPCLTNWQHFGKNEYLVGIEPGTNPPIGQKQARAQGALIMLKPGQSRLYDVEITVLNDQTAIEKFRKIGQLDLKKP
jgi:hypothetical protein